MATHPHRLALPASLIGAAAILQLPIIASYEPWANLSFLVGNTQNSIATALWIFVLVFGLCLIGAIAGFLAQRTAALSLAGVAVAFSLLGFVIVLGDGADWRPRSMLRYLPDGLFGTGGEFNYPFPAAYTVTWIALITAIVLLARTGRTQQSRPAGGAEPAPAAAQSAATAPAPGTGQGKAPIALELVHAATPDGTSVPLPGPEHTTAG